MDIEKLISELTLEEKAGLCSGRDFWHTKAVERLDIPEVMMCDGPHGLRKQVGEGDHLGINASIETNCYPTASALASSFDREVLHTLGEELGKECQAENVGMLLGPGLNMKRSPLCGRNFEYFSEDPYLAGELGAVYIESLQGEGISACVKHFAANNQETRRMSGSSQMDERTLHEIYLPAFEAAVKKGKTRSVMCAYNAINGTFAAENKELLTDILRKNWGFEGFVVTDWGAVKDRVKGLKAGLDLEMPGGPGTQDAKIVAAVKSGELPEEVLDEAVRNMLTFVRDYQKLRRENVTVDREEHKRLAGTLAEQCAVLMKNEEELLPLSKEENILYVGEFAEHPRYQGAGSSHINVPHPVSALEAAEKSGRKAAYARGFDIHEQESEEELIREAVEKAAKADKVVIFAGLTDVYESEGGDRESLAMPENQNRLINEIAKVQSNIILVLHGGSPVEMPWISKVKAILCMYLGGENVGTAADHLLYGDVSPSGKLAETWPLRLEDTPSYLNFPGENGVVTYAEGIYMGYRYYDKKNLDVLFPFGHGLSYSRFAYSDLQVDKQQMQDTETLVVSAKIKNTGKMKAKEVLELYVKNGKSDVRRPVRELRDFQKVELAPGEEKVVTFRLDGRAFAYYETKIHDWFVPTGDYDIEIGASSRDLRLHTTVHVTGTREIPMTYTRISTVADLMKTEKGRGFMEKMLAGRAKRSQEAAEENRKNMGEGSEKIVQSMMYEMPLGSLVTYGAVTEEQLIGILQMLNEK